MKPRALIVDDSLTVRMDIGEALSAAGFDAVPCVDLHAARDALREGCRLIVLDVLLPDGDGLDFLRELKAHAQTRGIPVLLLSAEAEVSGRVRGIGAGADEYVGKPYDLGQVVARARALVQAPAHDEARTRSVVVIDDSATYRHQLAEALEAAGHVVQHAVSGEEGLMLVASTRPAAVIVDGMLPGIDGATVVRRIRLDPALRSTPCVLLTAAEGPQDELRSLEAGADLYVRKTEDLGVVLARVAALLRGAQSVALDTTPSSLGPKRVLAIDDSSTYLRALGDQLRAEGHDVVLASCGEDGLELLAAQTVDCILLDLVMPGLSGQDTCRRIKQAPQWRDIPLIILTARDDSEAMIDGINAGADDYIAKSADFDVLRARLRAQLRRKHFEDENRRIREQLVNREAEARYARALESANEQLAAAKEQAEQSSRVKSAFLANMSHELRTPLNAIIGFAELLYDGQVTPDMPEHREFLGDILTSGRHLQQLINDVLDLSKVEAGKLEFQPERASLSALVSEVLTTLRALSISKRIEITSDIAPEADDITLDPSRLRQVLYNYVSNALKFTPEGGRIAVRARNEGSEMFRLEVQDSGIGIAQESMHLLFGEFQQLDASAAKRHAGTGLGLALTKRLVEAQGGSVGVHSTRGHGSTFFALLPRRATYVPVED